jgi:Crp-like helix-turn-helix domain
MKKDIRNLVRGFVRAGERTDTSGKPVRNGILRAISNAEFRIIRPHLAPVPMPNHFVLQEPRAAINFAYFPNEGLASIVVSMKGERDVEAGIVGYEGAVGTALAVGLKTTPLRVVMQIAGKALRIPAGTLLSLLRRTPELQMRLSRYAVLQGMQVAQTAACNRLHQVSRRLARWLLMAQDRVDSGTLEITHDFLATMLGTDRPSVTLAARRLQAKKAIRYRRARIDIVNRKRLESLTCQCYHAVQQLNGRLGLD